MICFDPQLLNALKIRHYTSHGEKETHVSIYWRLNLSSKTHFVPVQTHPVVGREPTPVLGLWAPGPLPAWMRDGRGAWRFSPWHRPTPWEIQGCRGRACCKGPRVRPLVMPWVRNSTQMRDCKWMYKRCLVANSFK